MHAFRQLALRAGLLLATILLMGGALEIGLRLFWDGYYLKTFQAYVEPHPVRGWANRRAIQVAYGEPEFNTTVTHDRWGFRSPEVSRERTPGRARVLVLGDSFAYGVGVEDDETFSARLAALEPGLEVINTGANGYGTGQELLLLRDEGLAFDPDVVIVSFFWNDVGNSYSNRVARFALEGDVLRHDPPPRRTAEQERAAAERRAAREQRRAWLRHSYAYRFLSDRAKLLGYWVKVAAGIPLEEADFVREVDRERAWALEFALLREIDRLAREHGARMLLLVIPDQVQVEPDVQVVGLSEADYQVQDRLRAFADEAGIEMLDALGPLREERERSDRPLYYLRDRHLVPRGQAILARALHARLESLGWLESSSSGS